MNDPKDDEPITLEVHDVIMGITAEDEDQERVSH